MMPPAATPIDPDQRLLLQSIVDVARAIFGAAASSVFIADEERAHLVFEAVSGAGEGELLGHRFPANRGIAGWVLASGQPLIVDDLSGDPTFARDIAEASRYVPRTLMAAPLLDGDNVLGVLEVLDHVPDARRMLGDLDLLGLFALQAALALRLARRAPLRSDDALASVVSALGTEDGRQLLAGLQRLLPRGI